MDEVNFYKDLQPQKLPLAQLFQEAHFFAVPVSWHVIISDVKNSTLAVSAGKHNDVNLVAAGSLIAALNIAKKYKVDIPFFFGGDGSTILVPQQLLKEVLAGLSAHNINTIKNFGLEMHIGSLSMKEILDNGHAIKIARLEVDAVYNKAIAIGDGFRFAEQKIKNSLHNKFNDNSAANDLNLTGLECRWDKIKPPVEEAEIVCYLIESTEARNQLTVYAEVFGQIEAEFGDVQKRNPLCTERLKPLLSLKKLRKEMLIKFGKWRIGYLIEAFLRTFFGLFYFKYNWKVTGLGGQEYLAQLIAHADTLTVDGRIDTIICGSSDKHLQFIEYLSTKEKEGKLIYGHHASRESIMTCYIESRNAKHIHFVDGADGGYTEAAKEFKSKLKLTPTFQ